MALLCTRRCTAVVVVLLLSLLCVSASHALDAQTSVADDAEDRVAQLERELAALRATLNERHGIAVQDVQLVDTPPQQVEREAAAAAAAKAAEEAVTVANVCRRVNDTARSLSSLHADVVTAAELVAHASRAPLMRVAELTSTAAEALQRAVHQCNNDVTNSDNNGDTHARLTTHADGEDGGKAKQQRAPSPFAAQRKVPRRVTHSIGDVAAKLQAVARALVRSATTDDAAYEDSSDDEDDDGHDRTAVLGALATALGTTIYHALRMCVRRGRHDTTTPTPPPPSSSTPQKEPPAVLAAVAPPPASAATVAPSSTHAHLRPRQVTATTAGASGIPLPPLSASQRTTPTAALQQATTATTPSSLSSPPPPPPPPLQPPQRPVYRVPLVATTATPPPRPPPATTTAAAAAAAAATDVVAHKGEQRGMPVAQLPVATTPSDANTVTGHDGGDDESMLPTALAYMDAVDDEGSEDDGTLRNRFLRRWAHE